MQLPGWSENHHRYLAWLDALESRCSERLAPLRSQRVLDEPIHAAELTTGPMFNQIATAVIAMMMRATITALMANRRAAMAALLSKNPVLSQHIQDSG